MIATTDRFAAFNAGDWKCLAAVAAPHGVRTREQGQHGIVDGIDRTPVNPGAASLGEGAVTK